MGKLGSVKANKANAAEGIIRDRYTTIHTAKIQYSNTEVAKMYYITYKNETVVYNSNKKLLVKCPTEQEAEEYINDHNNI